MDELGSLSALMGAIYDTTLDRSLWPSVLKQITRFIGGWGTALDYQDAVTKTVNVFYQDGGIAPRFIQLYNDKYRTLDPCAIGFFFAKVGEPIATADILPYEELLEFRAYNELVKPFGLVDCLKTVLDKSATAFASVSVFRHRRDGIVDEASRRRMRLIVPHRHGRSSPLNSVVRRAPEPPPSRIAITDLRRDPGQRVRPRNAL